MGKETIDSLVIEIGATSEKASDGIDSMLATLERLKGIVNAAGTPLNSLKVTFDELGNVKGASAALKKVGDTIKTTKPDYSSLASEIQGLAGDFASLSPEATKMVNATAKAESALRALSGVKASASVDDAADALKRLKASLDVGDVKGVANAFADLPPSMQKAVTASAKLEKSTSGATTGLKNMGAAADSVKDRLSAFTVAVGNLAADGIRSLVNGVGNMVGSLVNLDQTTEQYRASMGKLTTAFESAGYGAGVAKDTYSGLYAILGDTDQATEAAQLMAKLSASTGDMTTWTDIAAGVVGTFGDALPIEGLIEAANETAKVGTVTGQLADALNWAGISEDGFNEALAGMSTEAQRNQYIMDTLSTAYDEAGTAFYRNNEALIKARENQAALDDVMGKLGGTISNIKTNLMADFLPSITSVVSAFDGLLTGSVSAAEFSNQVSAAFSGIAEKITASLPAIVEAAGGIISGIFTALTDNLPQILEVGMQVIGQVAQGIVSALPEVLSVGLTIITTLVQGLAEALPELIPQAVETVVEFAGGILDNLDEIIDAGFELIEGLAEGVINAVPVLVEQAPVLIIKLVGGITTNLPQIIQSGVEMIGALISGLVKALPTLARSIPQIVRTVVNGLGNAVKSVVEVGKNIVRGLWNGITSLTGWIGEKVSGFVNGIMDRFTGKSGFDEHSPSKWAAEVGIMLGKGLGNGITSGASEALTAAKDMAKQIKNVDFAFADVRSSLPDFSKRISVPVYASLSMADPGKARMPAQTIPNTPNSYNYYVAASEAASYSVDYEPIDASSSDSDNIVSAIFAMASRLERAIQENSGRPVYVNGRDITRYQNQQNRMYGKTLQNT